MKIVKLRLRNLNSLAGEWLIDFSHPEYLSGGLFAITGPTGVGKSTILDAICLALYGSTPRLDKITQSSNEIMSRGSVECLAEVTFETPAGRYRCQWSQHRSRQKADGKLQAARHELVDDQSGRVIESQLSKTLGQVEKVTGMNFSQFTRSIMLAQGAFAAFLEAAPAERAELLEQITGTRIYSEISILTQQRESREKAAYKELENKLGLMKPGEADLDQLNREKKGLEESSRKIEREWNNKNLILAKLENLSRHKAKADELSLREKKLQNANAEMAPKTARLQLARTAQALAADQAALKQCRHSLGQTAADLKALLQEAGPLAKILAQAGQDEKTAEKELGDAKLEQEKQRPTILKARELDIELKEKDRQAKLLSLKLRQVLAALCQAVGLKAELDLPGFEKRLAEMKKRLGEKETAFKLLQEELNQTLAGQKPGDWRKLLSAAERQAAELTRLAGLRKDIFDFDLELKSNENKSRQADKDLGDIQEKLALTEALLAEIEKSRAALNSELAKLRRIESLDGQRHELAEGQACPLCGSLDHPWADAALRPSENLSQKENDLILSEKKIQETRKKINGYTADKSRLEQFIKNLNEASGKLSLKLAGISDEAKILGENLALDSSKAKDIKSLNEAAAVALASAKSASHSLLKIDELENSLKGGQEALQGAAKRTEESERLLAEFSGLSKEKEELDSERRKTDLTRQEILPGREAEAEEKRLLEKLNAAEKKYDQSRRKAEEALREQKANEARTKDAQSLLARLQNEAGRTEEAFFNKIKAAGFDSEEAWQQALMPEEEKAALEAAALALTEQWAALAESIKDNERGLAESAAGLPAEASVEGAKSELAALAGDRQNLHKLIGALEEKLSEQARLMAAQRQLLAELEAQKKEKIRWENLSSLIGSHDGQKYRNFAQGLCFALVVSQANHQLASLSDRYLLSCDESLALGLKVIDNYQGGEERSTRNLSGGESFIVSLALALGLSQMSSRRVRVDSLFLDEGFGTLDEDSLETVLETLSGLRGTGKLTGLISHIPALTERIPVQIKLRPLGGPFSAVSGPGVSGGPGPAV